MRILISTRAFLPWIGGLEIHVATLAGELVRLGQEVVVATTTPAGEPDRFPYRVVRRPSPGELLRLARGCDLFLQPNVSLRGLWPLLLVRRPWVVSHHSWYRRGDGRIAWQDRLKRLLLRRAAGSVAVSEAIAADLSTPSVVIANPYRDELFRRLPEVERRRDLIFLGRLVSDKGVDVLLDALGRLAREGLRPNLSVVGEGPEAPALQAQAARLGLDAQVRFPGTRTGEELVRLLNEHRVLVAPSRYEEPFGIVALEGIACGCVVVGSERGGLREAMGPCGRTFPNGDSAALAGVLAEVLGSPQAQAEMLRHAPAHLAEHTAAAVARRYLEVFEEALEGRRRR